MADKDRGGNRGNNNPLPRRIGPNQSDPSPTKEDRAINFRDQVGPLQSGAALRNRYEDGYFLPSQEQRDR